MPLAGPRWGTAIKNAVAGLSVPSDRVTTPAEQEAFWQAIAGEHVTEIVANALVATTTASTGATGVSTPGGPLPIVALPGTGTGGVT